MMRRGASFGNVVAALGTTAPVNAKFYSHEWDKARRRRIDAAMRGEEPLWDPKIDNTTPSEQTASWRCCISLLTKFPTINKYVKS